MQFLWNWGFLSNNDCIIIHCEQVNWKDTKEEFHDNCNMKIRKVREAQRGANIKNVTQVNNNLYYYIQVNKDMDKNYNDWSHKRYIQQQDNYCFLADTWYW